MPPLENLTSSSSHLYTSRNASDQSDALSGSHLVDSDIGQTSGGSISQTASVKNDSAQNGIEEGKQSAKALLDVSGHSLSSAAGCGHSAAANSPTMSAQSNGTNGLASNRKRSHSGSVIRPSPPATDHLPVRARETPVEKILLEQYVHREFHHSALAAWKNPHQEILRQKRAERDFYLALRRENQMNPAALYGVGYEGFGNARTDLKNHTQLLYPSHRRRPGGRKSRELRISRKDLKAQNEQLEDLVPIRLDIDWDKVKIRDAFTWNLHDRVLSPELFAEKFVEDLGLPIESCAPLVRMVAQAIQDQLTDYYPQVFMQEEALDDHLPYHAYKNDEMRILIKLNITIGQHTLVDQFEWDINDPYNSPEEFALRMTNDLALSGEFTTAIAHAIREQSQLFTKSLYIVSHPFDGRPVDDPDLKAAFLPSPVPSPFRPFQAAKEFTPYLYELNETALERTEVSISREQRRQKRSVNRRGGPALPDLKDRQRTIRTMVVSTVIPNSAATIEESNVFKRSGSSRHRRSAAQRDGGDDSDESDSEESSTGSPAIGPHLAQGTARTRGMRGAATAAHAALRASLGQSATPEPSHHQETTKASVRQRRDYREESGEESETLIVKLKMSREKLRALLKDLKTRVRPQPGSAAATQPSQSSNPQARTPTQAPMAPPPTQPKHAHPGRPHSGTRVPSQQIGAVDAPHSPQPGVPGVGQNSELKRNVEYAYAFADV